MMPVLLVWGLHFELQGPPLVVLKVFHRNNSYSTTWGLIRNANLPSLGGLAGWSIVLYTKRLQVQSSVRAHT